MGSSKPRLPKDRCLYLYEQSIGYCSRDSTDKTMTVVGNNWTEHLNSKTGSVSLWAKLPDKTRGHKEVDMQKKGFMDFMHQLAKKGPSREENYEGVD